MAEPNYQINAFKLRDAIIAAGSNPSSILQASIDAIEAASSGEVTFVDASTPALSIMETSSMVHAVGIDQHKATLRKVYPIQAQEPADLYGHMSYREYNNRFASPSEEPFMFFVPSSQFLAKAIRPLNADYVMMTIPRDSTITINRYVTFTLQYAINIKLYDNRQLEVSYDADYPSPLQTLKTSMLVVQTVSAPGSTEKYIAFGIQVPQVAVTKYSGNVQIGSLFAANYKFTDQYCMIRAWYRNTDGAPWTEMKTSYTPGTYDPLDPTLVVKVVGDTVNVNLPLLYQNTGLVTGEIRVDVYTTKGAEMINLGDYTTDQFVFNMAPLDRERDTNDYTAAALGVDFVIQSNAVLSGGKDALPFPVLRDRMIRNSVGPQEKPITNSNIQAASENRGFEIVPDIDAVTNRIFLATRSLPRPSNTRLVTSASIGVSTFISDDPKGISHPWVRMHGDRTTFLSKNLYRSDNGVLSLMGAQEVEDLKMADAITKLRTVNGNSFLYTPFYYVLDTSSQEMQTRVYTLDYPEARDRNFLYQNPSIQMAVNSDIYSLQKVDKGYILQIQTRSGVTYKNLQDNEVYCQLAVRLLNTDRYGYWLGKLVGKTANGERIFQFELNTDYDIDAEDQIFMTNGQITSTTNVPIEMDLTSKFDIFHITSSLTQNYEPSGIDQIIGRFQFTEVVAAATHEQLVLEFGKPLKSLWTRSRTLPDSEVYERYATDVPLVYDADEYAEPPFIIKNNKLEYQYIAKAGQPVLDAEGNPKLRFRKGDIVYQDGKPVVSATMTGNREFDIMTVEGQFYFVDDPAYLDYRNEFTRLIISWVTEDLPLIQANALEKTKIYFFPKNQLATTSILVGDYTEETIPSGQSLAVDLYVPDGVYRDSSQRNRVMNLVISYLDEWIKKTEVAVSTATTGIVDLMGDDVKAVNLRGLGGEKNLKYVIIAKDQTRMSLKRTLEMLQNGKFYIKEDVLFNFYKADPIPVDFT